MDKYYLFIIVEDIYIIPVIFYHSSFLSTNCKTKARMQTSWFAHAKIIDIISAVPHNNIAQQQNYRFAVGKFAENQGHNPQKWFECQMEISQ